MRSLAVNLARLTVEYLDAVTAVRGINGAVRLLLILYNNYTGNTW
jgi:hypothetical protein